jgi:ATP-dependent DNA helicase RecQ
VSHFPPLRGLAFTSVHLSGIMGGSAGDAAMPPTADPLAEVIARHWGYSAFRPLQREAMQAVLDGRDSVVVLPTGGGKSLCYQAPAVLLGGTTVVISPLIALMKDQVDGLRECGVAAAQLDSSLTPAEKAAYEADLRQGAVRLLYVSPERLVGSDLFRVLQRLDVRTFAIDEAHCISHWGHDFRPEYRQLSRLRELFPEAAVHAYTATATEPVRRDVAAQLGMREPLVLVGDFDRANLTFRVLPRHDPRRQTLEVVERHHGEAGIVYCISRKEVEELAEVLRARGVKALPYHAGLPTETRQQHQDAFLEERCDVVVATVAFGMGIDRSDVRFVLHTGMPKSLEHYQQEAGRAGRDGLEAECVLLYSGADVMTWKRVMEKSATEAGAGPDFLRSAFKHLDDMDRYCRGAVCRHKALVEYFGQRLERPGCGACDLCLGDTEEVPDALVVAQKVLSCVARVQQGFGVGHVIAVLRGEGSDAVRRRGHDKLTTYGLLRDVGKAELRDWVYQLIGQGALLQVGDEYPLLKLNEASWEVMRGKLPVRLVRLARRKKGERPERAALDAASWEGVDRPLLEALKALRRDLMAERGVRAAYIIFHDATLRELARVRPTTPERLRRVSGVGDARLRDYGERVLAVIGAHCREHALATDVSAAPPPLAPREPRLPGAALSTRHGVAFERFRAGAAVEEVAAQMGLSRGTVHAYLEEHIRADRPRTLRPWVDDDTYYRVVDAARQVGTARLKPIFLLLGEKVSYDAIRLVLAHLQGREGGPNGPPE